LQQKGTKLALNGARIGDQDLVASILEITAVRTYVLALETSENSHRRAK